MRETLARYGSCTLAQDGCSTCGDVAVPVRVLAVDGREAHVKDRTGTSAVIAIDFVPDVRLDDVLLVHLGVAIGRAEDHERRGAAP